MSTVTCPCGKVSEVVGEVGDGRQPECPECGATLSVPNVASPPAGPSSTAAPRTVRTLLVRPLLGGILAGFALKSILDSLYYLTIPEDTTLLIERSLANEVAASAAGWLFGGFFAASLANARPRVIGLLTGLIALALVTFNQVYNVLPFVMDGSVGWGEAARIVFSPRVILPYLVAPVTAFAGAEILVRLGNWSRLARPRQEWDYATRSGETIRVSSPWQHPWIARFWLFMAAAFLATWAGGAIWSLVQARKSLAEFGASGLGLSSLSVAYTLLMGMLNLPMLFLCYAFYTLGTRNVMGSAGDLLRRDDRPPIVYLRSFGDDGRTMLLPPRYLIYHPFRALLDLSIEQRLTRAFSSLGPSIAIGRPGETLPELGAHRLYVSDARWQDVIRDALDRAGFAVIMAAKTPNLGWEMGEVASRLKPDQALLFIPFPLTRDRAIREDQYREFRTKVEPHFPGGLPETIGDAFFIYFAADPPWSPLKHARRDPLPEGHPLRPALAKAAKNWRFRRALHLTKFGAVMDSIGIALGALTAFIVLTVWFGWIPAVITMLVVAIGWRPVTRALSKASWLRRSGETA